MGWLEGIPGDTFGHVAQLLTAQELSRLACGNKFLSQLTQERKVWVKVLVQDFLVKHKAEKICSSEQALMQWPELRRLFAAPDAPVFRRKVCVKALQKLIHLGQCQDWPDLKLFASTIGNQSVLVQYGALVELSLYARESIEAYSDSDDSNEDEDEEEANEELGMEKQYPQGTGPYLLGPSQCADLLHAAVARADVDIVRIILIADTDEEGSGRLSTASLKTAAINCGRSNFSSGCASILASLTRKDKTLMESTIAAALIEAAASGHAAFTGNMVRMLFARYNRDAAALEEKQNAESLSPDEIERHQADLQLRRDTMEATLKQALTLAAKFGYLDVIQEVLGTPAAKQISPQIAKVAARTGAMNGATTVVQYFFSKGFLEKSDVLELFSDSCRRGYAQACTSLLSLNLLDKEYLEFQKREAFLREHDEVVSVIEDALPTAPDAPANE